MADQKAAQPARVATTSAPAPSWLQITKALIAGGVAGGVSRTAVAPLERLKILQQVHGANGGQQYATVWKGLTYMARTEGFRGMMKGNGANVIRIVPNSAMKFLCYEKMSQFILEKRREQLGDPNAEMTPVLRLGAGAVAGIFAMSSTYPLDMVRGRLTVQSENGRYRGIAHATVTIIREEGPRALYKGWLPSVIGVVPYVGLNFAVYETLKDVVLKAKGLSDDRDLDVVTRLGCGAFAGSVGQTVAYPLDVVRRRLQVAGWKVVGADGVAIELPPAYNGMVDCFVKTVRQEGFFALFKGLWPNYIKVVPSIAIAFVTYEQLKTLMGVDFKISE